MNPALPDPNGPIARLPHPAASKGSAWHPMGQTVYESLIPVIFRAASHNDEAALSAAIARVSPGLDPWNERDESVRTPLHHAVIAKSTSCVRILCEQFNIDVSPADAHKVTPLHAACALGALDSVNILLHKDANIEARDSERNTPLLAAARWGHAPCIEALVRAGANVFAKNRAHFTAVHKAAAHDHPDCIRALVAAGARVDALSRRRWTPLHYACDLGRVQSARELLQSGANPNARAFLGHTPLHVSAEKGMIGCIMQLVNAGADLDATTKTGRTPLALAHAGASMETDACQRTIATLLAVGAACPDNMRLSEDGKDIARLYITARRRSISDDAVARVSERVLTAIGAPETFECTHAHAVARALVTKENRDAIVSRLLESAPAFDGIDIDGVATREGTLFDMNRIVVDAAIARICFRAVRAAETDAAMHTVPLLPAAAIRGYPSVKHVYAAIVCAARWGVLRSCVGECDRECSRADIALAAARDALSRSERAIESMPLTSVNVEGAGGDEDDPVPPPPAEDDPPGPLPPAFAHLFAPPPELIQL